jgi:ATP-binding cassette subfamily B protein
MTPADPRATPARKLRPLHSLLPYLRPYRGRIALAALFLLCAAAATLAVPAAIRVLVDGGLMLPGSTPADVRIDAVGDRFMLLFAACVALGVFTAARFYTVTWLGERVTADLRQAVYAHVLTQSPEFFETLKTGEVL